MARGDADGGDMAEFEGGAGARDASTLFQKESGEELSFSSMAGGRKLRLESTDADLERV